MQNYVNWARVSVADSLHYFIVMTLQLEIVSKHRDIVGDDVVHLFREEGGSIGRSLKNDWVLADPERFISGQHAAIDYRGGIYYLIDTSTNGVYFNDDCKPAGKGTTRRLFNGDRLRFGSFEIAVSIDEEGPNDIRRPGLPMSDNAVQVPILADPFAGQCLHDAPETDDLLENFLHGLGLVPTDLHPSADLARLMRNAGEVLREFVEGTTQLLASRADLKDVFELDQTTVLPRHNNPIKLSANTRDSILQLLVGREGEYLGPRDAAREVCRDLQFHQEAVLDAMSQAFAEFAGRIDPKALRDEFDETLSTNILTKQFNKSKYWEMYVELYPILNASGTNRFPRIFAEEFVKTYERQIADYQHRGDVQAQTGGQDATAGNAAQPAPQGDDTFGATDPSLAYIDIDELEAALANDDIARG